VREGRKREGGREKGRERREGREGRGGRKGMVRGEWWWGVGILAWF
jgi:hypothetical protein